jgi:hypothetical protein
MKYRYALLEIYISPQPGKAGSVQVKKFNAINKTEITVITFLQNAVLSQKNYIWNRFSAEQNRNIH